MRMRLMLVLCAALALTVGVATATADGPGNSDAAKACQKGGWQKLVREDGTPFKNTGDCVSYAAQGGKLQPACVAGSENFSGFTPGDQPTTFAGGTIDTAYSTLGGVFGPIGAFTGNSLFTGLSTYSFQLTFTKAVGSVQLDAEPNNFVSSHQLTLTGSDAANNVVDTDTVTAAAGIHLNALAVSDGNTIKHFTIAADAGSQGIFFSNIVWTCN